MVASDQLIGQESRQKRRLAIVDMEGELVRIERLLTVISALLDAEVGLSETKLEARKQELVGRAKASPQYPNSLQRSASHSSSRSFRRSGASTGIQCDTPSRRS